jgi:hypothetical protein
MLDHHYVFSLRLSAWRLDGDARKYVSREERTIAYYLIDSASYIKNIPLIEIAARRLKIPGH